MSGSQGAIISRSKTVSWTVDNSETLQTTGNDGDGVVLKGDGYVDTAIGAAVTSGRNDI